MHQVAIKNTELPNQDQQRQILKSKSFYSTPKCYAFIEILYITKQALSNG